MDPSVLIISTRVDAATDAVAAELSRRGRYFVRFDTDRYPYEARLSFLTSDGAPRLELDGTPLRPGSVWYRRVRSPEPPNAMDPGIHEYCVREAQALVLGTGLTARGRILSPPEAIVRAENKVAQLAFAQALGLAVPATCVSNDPAAIRAFATQHERLVSKPLRSGWYRDAEGEWSIYTNEVTADLLDDPHALSLAPCIFQELIPKACDVRVTIVGDRVFTAEIESQSDEAARIDWRRTTNPDLPHRRAELPPVVQTALLDLVRQLGLHFGAIDLVRTPDDRYVFLEVNPNGQWLWLDDKLELGITRAVADWLCADGHG